MDNGIRKINPYGLNKKCNILTWPAGVNTADVVDRYIDKIGVINLNITMPTGAVCRRMLRQLHPVEDNINKVIIRISLWPMDAG